MARRTVQRLMKAAGLRGVRRTGHPRTTVPAPGPDSRGDLVQRKFSATGPDQLWVTDIERREALFNRVEVKDRHRRPVAAGW
ncbi:transposase InsO family protein [Nocardiopsis mwathae]|uniref:Transposase InsO family protein n=1 Tax=Nocardiopsis mwathae TaxID=1472723 RepID=A0A7W9YIS2_9ACTN|nr:hypothetical protein [Nocardiopsis mwathae]MBB6172874.1 transposase InsO family protein [Nocardiopsis mwathae]